MMKGKSRSSRTMLGIMTTALALTGAGGTALAETTTYSGAAQGLSSTVNVEVSLEDGKIVDVVVDDSGETYQTQGIESMQPLVEALIENGTPDGVDGIAGATFTSDAILTVAAEAVASAQGEDVASTEAEALSMTAGTYTGSGKGYFSQVEVEVAVSENAIDSITVTANAETPQIWVTVDPVLTDRILAAQSLAVDSVTGATVSSNAVKTAVREALTQAGASEKAMYAPVEKSAEVLEYEADVVVVGAGTSGSSAAAQATQLGADVVLVEKSGRIGGSGAISSGILGIGSSLQKEQGLTFDVDGVFNEWMEGQHWMIPNAQLLSRYLHMTGDTVDWLVDNGFVFGSITSFDGTDETDVHWYEEPAGNGAFGVAGKQFFEGLTKDVKEVLLETEITDFLKDENGSIIGVTGVRYDGAVVNVKAPYVILATGGFAGNPDLQKEFYNGKTYRFFGLLQNDGTAIRLGRSIGAVLANPTTACAHFFAPVRDVTGFDPTDTNILYDIVVTPSLLNVNQNGVRFADESNAVKGWLESAQYRFQQGTYYTVISQSQIDALAAEGTGALGLTEAAVNIPFLGHATDPAEPLTNIQVVLDAAVDQGIAYRGETAAELAEAAGMNAEIFEQNLQNYEALCENGEDTAFSKAAAYLQPLGDGPYYAIASCAVPYNTMGGLLVNENCQVVDENYAPIDGLYCVGMDAMGTILDGVGYPDFGGPATSWALNSGRIAAQEIAEKLAE